MRNYCGLYVTPSGVGFQGSGLLLADRETKKEKSDKAQLRGFFVDGRGFTTSLEDANSNAVVEWAFARYQRRAWRCISGRAS